MRTNLVALPAGAAVSDLRQILAREAAQRGQHLYPVVDDERRIKGVITRKQLLALTSCAAADSSRGDVLTVAVVVHPDEPLRVVVSRMAETGRTGSQWLTEIAGG